MVDGIEVKAALPPRRKVLDTVAPSPLALGAIAALSPCIFLWVKVSVRVIVSLSLSQSSKRRFHVLVGCG